MNEKIRISRRELYYPGRQSCWEGRTNRVSHYPSIFTCLMKLFYWSKILVLFLRFIITVDATKSFDKMKNGKTLCLLCSFKFGFGMHCWVCRSNTIIGQNVFTFAFCFYRPLSDFNEKVILPTLLFLSNMTHFASTYS